MNGFSSCPAGSDRPLLRRKKAALALLLSMLAGSWVYGAYHIDPSTIEREAAEQPSAAIDELFRSLRTTAGFQGAVILGDDGEIAVERGYGSGIDADTPFSIGSLSKQFTGLLFAELVAGEEVQLADRVSKYVPELTEHGVGDATVQQLLRMRAGLPYYYDLSFVLRAQLRDAPMTTEDRIAELAGYELEFSPGSDFLYSNLGYVLLSVIAERATHEEWRALLEQRVFQPAGLRSSGIFDQTTPDESVAGHLPLQVLPGVAPAMIPLPRWKYSMLFGAGGMYSTVRDLYRWDRYLARLERERGDVYALFSTRGQDDYTFGIGNKEEHGITVQSHSGEDPGFFSYVARIPERGRLIAFLSNTDLGMGNCSYRVDAQLRNLLLGRPYVIPAR